MIFHYVKKKNEKVKVKDIHKFLNIFIFFVKFKLILQYSYCKSHKKLDRAFFINMCSM